MSERVLPFDDPIYQEMCGAVALGSVRGPYTQVVDGVPHLDIGAVVAEIIASPALAEVERAAAEKAVAKVRAEIRQVPRWWNSEQGYGEFDLQPLGPNETSEKGAYMEVMRVLDECTEAYRRERKE